MFLQSQEQGDESLILPESLVRSLSDVERQTERERLPIET
jgi:hypothetical protein